MTERQRPYLAYLLRLWQIQDKEKFGWRASLENAHTGEKLAFANLDELIAFLRERTGLAPPAERPVEQERMPQTDSVSTEGGSE